MNKIINDNFKVGEVYQGTVNGKKFIVANVKNDINEVKQIQFINVEDNRSFWHTYEFAKRLALEKIN